MKKNIKKQRVCLVSMPPKVGDDIETRTADFIRPIKKLTNKIILITGPIKNDTFDDDIVKTITMNEYRFKERSPVIRILRLLFHQLKMCRIIYKNRDNFDIIIFRLGGPIRIFPIILSKFLNKKIVLFLTTSFSNVMKVKYKEWLFGLGGRLVNNLSKLILFFNCWLSDRIVLLSNSMIGMHNFFLKKEINSKIVVCYDRFINPDLFYKKIDLNKRDNIIGFVGRFSKEKGILNLIEALSFLPELKIFLIGSGYLSDQINEYSIKNKLKDKIKIIGQIPHNELNEYFNQFKLLVLPSYSEGLPTVILESMSSGTPVLSTSVGGIPDIIKDKKTGFLMKDNSPMCIARNVKRAINYPELDDISVNAKNYVNNISSEEKIIENYRRVLFGLQ